jgi:hypothetical protein
MIVVPDSNIFIAQVIPLEYTEAAEHKGINLSRDRLTVPGIGLL